MSAFKKQQMRPFPGLQVNIDGFMGVIKTVSGGRVIVDFNHPLAGRDVMYEVMVKRVVTDAKEKIGSFLKMNVFGRDIPFTFDKGKLVVEFAIPKEMQEQIVKKLKEVIPEIKDVTFEEMKEKKDKATTQQ
jgi:FKBP-type peptidyl-prolyl cis-trans isomerase 2